MRLKIAIVAAGIGLLLLLGLRPQSLPFIPEARFSDAVVSHWPAALHLRQSVLELGTFPLWQDTILAGGPFAANPLNKTAYPLQWLALIFQPAPHINLMILLHLFLAGWGMWRWGRLLGMTDVAAVFCGLAYAFAPKIIAHIGAGHVDLLYALAWWPWLMASVFQLARASNLSARLTLQVDLFATLVFLSDVRLSLFALALALAYGLAEVIKSRRWRVIVWPLPSVAIFIVLTLSVTIPLLAWQPWMNRASLTPDDAGVFALEGGQLVGLLLPPHSGNPETIAYLSLPILLLASIALVSALRKHIFWLGVILFSALYALGQNGPLWPLLVNVFPFLLWFRVPSRAWFVVVLASCLLAGHGLQTLMQTVERLRQDNKLPRLALKRLAIAGGMGASLFCGGFTLLVLTDLPMTIGIGVIATGVLLGVVLLLGFYRRLSPPQLAYALIAVLFIDLAWTGYQWLEWRGPDTWLTHQTELVERLQSDNPARIYSPNFALEQQVAAANDLHLFYGVDPFQLTGIADAITQGSGVSSESYSITRPPMNLDDGGDPDEALRLVNRDSTPDTGILAQWAVSHVVATYPITHERLSLAATIGDLFVYRNLDFAGDQTTGWPDWDGLPDEATIARLNQFTIMAALVSALGLVICLVAWRFMRDE